MWPWASHFTSCPCFFPLRDINMYLDDEKQLEVCNRLSRSEMWDWEQGRGLVIYRGSSETLRLPPPLYPAQSGDYPSILQKVKVFFLREVNLEQLWSQGHQTQKGSEQDTKWKMGGAPDTFSIFATRILIASCVLPRFFSEGPRDENYRHWYLDVP